MNLIEINATRQIPASPDEVYAAWIDPTCPGGPWFAPNANGMEGKTILDAKVDGLFYHRVTNKGGAWIHYGLFTRVEPGALVEHTWVCEATHGRESIVTTKFEARDGGTFVTLTQTGVPDDEQGRFQDAGWKWVLGALADAMAKRAK